MLDKDLAVLYGVKPILLREQVKRNLVRFLGDFMFQLSQEEIDVRVRISDGTYLRLFFSGKRGIA